MVSSSFSGNPEREKPSILLIDDSLEEQRRLMDLLRPLYRLSVAFDGQQGYQRALAVHPDLILLDVSMPKMDGYSACHLLKADPLTQDIPVIFLSSMNTPEERIHGLMLGGVDYVSKPFSPEEVIVRIRIHLDLARSKPDALAPQPAMPSRNPDEVALTAVKRLIVQRLDTLLTLTELAHKVGVHEKKLSQIFREHTGLTVFTFIREERLRRARQLLAETDLSIQDIALQVGFQNPANFATAFRERMGATPRDYRLSMRPEKTPPC